MNEQFSRYMAQAQQAMAGWAGVTPPTADRSVGLALPAARLLLRNAPADHAGLGETMAALGAFGEIHGGDEAVPLWRDEAGHGRDVYHLFTLHLCLSAFLTRFESLDPATWSRCEANLESAIQPARRAEAFVTTTPPPELAAITLWQGLVLLEAGLAVNRLASIELVDSLVQSIVAAPGEHGTLHRQHPNSSLDAWTWRELTGLHALAWLALRRKNRAWSQRVHEIARYHLENTQPDNTTNQPWGLFAFAQFPDTASMAEQQLHDAMDQGSVAVGGRDGPGAGVTLVAGLLLADAAACSLHASATSL